MYSWGLWGRVVPLGSVGAPVVLGAIVTLPHREVRGLAICACALFCYYHASSLHDALFARCEAGGH